MFPAALAMALFATSSVAARRSIHFLGPNNASLVRILVATTFLGIYAHTWGAGFSGPSLGWFLLSGLVGFGICDTALFLALPRLGAQMASLLVQCLSVPVGLFTEWAWLGTAPTPPQLGAIVVILTGVFIALKPSPQSSVPSPGPTALALGCIAAAGQGLGAVISRHGTQLAARSGHPIDGLSVAYQRIGAGVAFIAVWWLIQRARQVPSHPDANPQWKPALPWIAVNALSGPTLGVACYQWALAHQPTGIVMAVTSLTPLAVIPIAWHFQREQPSRASLLGGITGIGGVIALALLR
jgi:drug/metabolite transporter (DMT)-like permease